MSRTCNNFYFDTIEEIENSGEDYNRNYSVKALQEVGFSEKEANDFCDDLESKWNIQVDYLSEVEKEENLNGLIHLFRFEQRIWIILLKLVLLHIGFIRTMKKNVICICYLNKRKHSQGNTSKKPTKDTMSLPKQESQLYRS